MIEERGGKEREGGVGGTGGGEEGGAVDGEENGDPVLDLGEGLAG